MQNTLKIAWKIRAYPSPGANAEGPLLQLVTLYSKLYTSRLQSQPLMADGLAIGLANTCILQCAPSLY